MLSALSGPDGLAARLRAALDSRPLTTVSLPLDIGAATETIPAHLRRAAATRHPHCAFPGCDQPASVCDIHHLIPRARGGPTALHNLAPLCGFHHQIAVHRWGWVLRLNPDGATTATSPDRTRTLHSHGRLARPRNRGRPPTAWVTGSGELPSCPRALFRSERHSLRRGHHRAGGAVGHDGRAGLCRQQGQD